MRDKLYKIINNVYGTLLLISLFAGILPVIPFLLALCIGGEKAEKICLFLYNSYYPWVIATAAIAVIIGLVGVYIKQEKKLNPKEKQNNENVEKNPQNSNQQTTNLNCEIDGK